MAVARAIVTWAVVAGLVTIPLLVAAQSEYLPYRDSVYIAAGFAGVVGLAILLVQPLLAAGLLPGLPRSKGRRLHLLTGTALVFAIVVHVAGLWATSPPDMIDALTFTAPTAFSVFGVVAMWAVLAAALLAVLRKRLGLRPTLWRLAHSLCAALVVIATVVHAALIEGTMGPYSKAAICAAVVASFALAFWQLRPWAGLRRITAQDQDATDG